MAMRSRVLMMFGGLPPLRVVEVRAEDSARMWLLPVTRWSMEPLGDLYLLTEGNTCDLIKFFFPQNSIGDRSQYWWCRIWKRNEWVGFHLASSSRSTVPSNQQPRYKWGLATPVGSLSANVEANIGCTGITGITHPFSVARCVRACVCVHKINLGWGNFFQNAAKWWRNTKR